MIHKLLVLLRVKYFQKGVRRISAEVGAYLIHLVQKKDGVAAAALLDCAHHPAGYGSYIGSPVPAYFGFVAHAAHGHMNKLAAYRPCDGFCYGSLAHSGRTYQAQYAAFFAVGKGSYGKVF